MKESKNNSASVYIQIWLLSRLTLVVILVVQVDLDHVRLCHIGVCELATVRTIVVGGFTAIILLASSVRI